MTESTLDFQEHPDPEDLRRVLDGVRAYNREMSGNERPRAVACFLRGEQGRIVGGVQGDVWGHSMHIAALWVDAGLRGQGHGSALMKAIEDYARAQDHPLIYLETTSFQARPFYESLGYRVFGELPEISPGHTLYFLMKLLTGARASPPAMSAQREQFVQYPNLLPNRYLQRKRRVRMFVLWEDDDFVLAGLGQGPGPVVSVLRAFNQIHSRRVQAKHGILLRRGQVQSHRLALARPEVVRNRVHAATFARTAGGFPFEHHRRPPRRKLDVNDFGKRYVRH